MTTENNLFEEYKKTKNKDIRDKIVDQYTYIAKILAYKFCFSGVEYEDLYQVACVGLILAADRFEPSLGYQFSTFATSTVSGEIKRFIRDKVRCIRVPRELYEILGRAESECNRVGDLSIEALSDKLGVPKETLNEAYAAGDLRFIELLEEEASSDGDRTSGIIIGKDDNGYELVEDRDFLNYCMSKLNDTERRLFEFRILMGKSQTETAKEMGISQMQVSRLEKKMYSKLKKEAENY